jgi:hypothetical protein
MNDASAGCGIERLMATGRNHCAGFLPNDGGACRRPWKLGPRDFAKLNARHVLFPP